MDLASHVLLMATVTVAYGVFGMTGFGAAMVAVPVLVQVMPLHFAVPLILLLDIVATTSLALRNRRRVAFVELARLLPFLLIGVFIGATILARLSSRWLLIALGVFVLLMAARSLLAKGGQRPPLATVWAAPAGLAGGIFSALFGTGGPIYTMYLWRRLPDTEDFRATIAAVIFLSAIVRSAAFAATGLLQQDALWTTALSALPFCLVGLAVGSRLRHRLSPDTARRLLLGLLSAGALGAIYRGAVS